MKSFQTLLLLLSLPLMAFAQPAHKLGWRSSPTHNKGLKQFVHSPAAATTPIAPSSDLSSSLHMPPIYDQGQIGSCTANAILAAYEFAYHQLHGSFMNGSRLGLYYDERVHDGDPLQDGGSTTASGLYVLAGGGVGIEKCWPYTTAKFAQKPKSCYYTDAKKFTTVTAYDVDNTDHVSIRRALSAGFPVIFGGYVYSDIENMTAANYFLPMPKGKPVGGHEELIVGHNDTMKHTYPDGVTITGFYLIRGSWGTSYANRGYFLAPMAYIESSHWNNDFACISLTK